METPVSRLAAPAAAWAALLLAPSPVAAQAAGLEAHARLAGCYAIAPAAAAPWLLDVGPSVRLTLDVVASDPGQGPQYAVRPAAARPDAPKYSYQAWSLLGDGVLVSIVWASDRDQIGLTFAPDPGRTRARSIGSTTLFTHETMRTTDDVDVEVTAIACGP